MTKTLCSLPECTRVAFRKGLCNHDYRAQLGKTCTECPDPVLADGLCTKHYYRRKRYGDVDAVAFIKGDDEARFWSHVDRRGDDECWPWTGATDTNDYGVFRMPDRPYQAHRWGYEHFVAPIPKGLTIDHVKDQGCTRKDCVNFLAHLEVVTHRVNILRGDGIAARNARKTHCIRDHEFTSENTMVRKNGGRTCRKCKKLREQGLV